MSDEKERKEEDDVEADLEDEDAVEGDDDLEDEDDVEGDDDLEGEDDVEGDDDLEDDEDDEDDGVDMGERVLCVDGACIGVVGADGRCKVCGTENPDYEPPSPAQSAGSADNEVDVEGDDDLEDDDNEDDLEDEETRGAGSDDPLDFANRVLCSDGACVGIIGADGRCRECGKPLSEEED